VASIDKRIAVDVASEAAWRHLRDVGRAHELFTPVLTECRLEGDVRTVRFGNGMVLREQILDVDDAHRRVAYAALDAPGMRYHHASMQVVEDGAERCVFVWTTDFLPAEARGDIAPLIDQGAAAFKRNLEKA
jgi:Polyketide cyclase / dehydrase and lipid transport